MRSESPGFARVPQLRALWKEAFGDTDAFLDGFFETGFSPDRCRCIVQADTVVSALYWFDGFCQGQRFAYLYAVATAASMRGRGLFTALLADVKELLAQQGYDGILLVPEDAGLAGMYEKLGFTCCTTVEVCTVGGVKKAPSDEGAVSEADWGREEPCGSTTPPSACSADTSPDKGRPGCVRQIGAAEFAQLRRELLPEKAVLQEGAVLKFLASQYRFYAGADFLAVGLVHEGKFYAQEFLGRRAAMAPLVAAVGAEEGIFRCPGKGKPFAYLLKLRETCVEPDYFALALD